MSPFSNVVLCKCGYAGVVAPDLVRHVSSQLAEHGVAVHTVYDLCDLAARRDPLLGRLAQSESLKVLACYPRAVKWLFAAAGAPLRPDARLFNLRNEAAAASAAEVVESVLAGGTPRGDAASQPSPLLTNTQGLAPTVESAQHAAPSAGPGVNSWFPVIDFDRCTHCLDCLSFCLFGVYAVDQEHRVRVSAPESCKPNCPACARVCPQVAIIFPKYGTAPVNGEAVSDSAPREIIKVNISSLLGGDVYAKLRERRGPRFSTERDPEQALRERQTVLAKLVELGDIPPELLSSLSARNSPPAQVTKPVANDRSNSEGT